MHFISILGAYLSVQPRTITIAHQCYKINPTEENSPIIPTPIIIPKFVRSTTLFFSPNPFFFSLYPWLYKCYVK